MIGHISFDDINPSVFSNFSKKWPRKTFGRDISSLIFSVHIVSFDSFFGNFLLNEEMSKFNVLCPCDGFDYHRELEYFCN